MAWRRSLLLLTFLALPGCGAAEAVVEKVQPEIGAEQDRNPYCAVSLDAVPDAPRVDAYPAAVVPVAARRPPVLDTPDKRLFRTMIREGAKQEPNFAGSYILARWGCGTGCINYAIISPRTGKVTFDLGQDASSAPYDRIDHVTFARESRLLVVNQWGGGAGEGLSFFEWTGERLRLIRHVPRPMACRPLPADAE